MASKHQETSIPTQRGIHLPYPLFPSSPPPPLFLSSLFLLLPLSLLFFNFFLFCFPVPTLTQQPTNVLPPASTHRTFSWLFPLPLPHPSCVLSHPSPLPSISPSSPSSHSLLEPTRPEETRRAGLPMQQRPQSGLPR